MAQYLGRSREVSGWCCSQHYEDHSGKVSCNYQKVRRAEVDIINSRFATAISESGQCDFWQEQEVKQLRCQHKGVCC